MLLSSTTVSGLQKLINKANANITRNGLTFNPQKTECLLVEGNPFTETPQWYMDGVSLNIVDKITYLGTILGDSKGQGQTTQRIQAANRAFYSLQGAGLNCCGVSPHTAIHIYSTAVRSCLTYGCSAVNISKTKIKELDKIQGKHIKCIL